MALRLGVIKQNKLIIHPSTLMPLVSFVLLPQVYELSLNIVSPPLLLIMASRICVCTGSALVKKVGVRQITEMLSCGRRGDKQPKLLHSM